MMLAKQQAIANSQFYPASAGRRIGKALVEYSDIRELVKLMLVVS